MLLHHQEDRDPAEGIEREEAALSGRGHPGDATRDPAARAIGRQMWRSIGDPLRMSIVGQIFVFAVVGGIVVAFVVALRRMGWLGKTDRRVSTGMAAALQDMNHMFQPEQPAAEDRAEIDDEGAEDEGDGDGDDPERRRPGRSRRSRR